MDSAFQKCPDKAFPFSLSEKSNYHIISLNGSSEPIFHNIWWDQFWHSLHDSGFIVARRHMRWQKGDNDFFVPAVTRMEEGEGRITNDNSWCPGVNTNVIMEVQIGLTPERGRHPLLSSPSGGKKNAVMAWHLKKNIRMFIIVSTLCPNEVFVNEWLCWQPPGMTSWGGWG